MFSLNGKVALITGASSGIGRSAAKIFAQHGATIVLSSRREAELRQLAAEIEAAGGKAAALAGDVRDESHAEKLVRLAVEEFGGLDVALNNAGGAGSMGEVPQLSLQDWQDTVDVNLTSAFLGAKYQIPALLERQGSLIFTSSFVGHTVGMPGMAAYAAAKAGLVGLTQTLAAEYGPRGLRVNALLPGGTDTPGATMKTPEQRRFVEGLHAMKRLAQPEEIARAALFLASDSSSFVTGTALLADGGISITRT